jgi:hypothetical protein
MTEVVKVEDSSSSMQQQQQLSLPAAEPLVETGAPGSTRASTAQMGSDELATCRPRTT